MAILVTFMLFYAFGYSVYATIRDIKARKRDNR